MIAMSLTHREYEFDAKISDDLFMFISKEDLNEKLPAVIRRFINISKFRGNP